MWDVVWCKVDAIESIGNVQFDDVDWAVCWVGKKDMPEDAIECVPKLHGFHRS